MILALKKRDRNKNYKLLFKKYTMRLLHNTWHAEQDCGKFRAINKYLRTEEKYSVEEFKREQTKNKDYKKIIKKK